MFTNPNPNKIQSMTFLVSWNTVFWIAHIAIHFAEVVTIFFAKEWRKIA